MKKYNRRNARLSTKSVLAIRAKAATGKYTQRELATAYCVTPASISMLVNRKTWKTL